MLYSDSRVSQQWQISQTVWSLKFLRKNHKKKQILSSVIGKIFNEVKIYSMDKFKKKIFAFDYKEVDNNDESEKTCRVLVEEYQFSTNQKYDEIFQIHLVQLGKQKFVLWWILSYS